jgi:tetratricopeptide (TPR) repeat protein
MTKAVLEAESEGIRRQTAATIPSPALAVPASLHASLMARLDRLGPAKEIAQVGAAIGREFSQALLAAVVSKPEADLAAALDRLLAAGLLFQQGVPPHSTYLFKHALVQDAAYSTLLREPQRALHARIADVLDGQFAEIAENQPELLARHCADARQVEKAAGLWSKAGQRSLARSAYIEAAEQLNRALTQISSLPSTPALRREQIKLQVSLITPLVHVKGYAAPEAKAAAERARLLIEQSETLGEPLEDDPLLLFSALYGIWAANYVAFNGDSCVDLARDFVANAEKKKATAPLMIGHRNLGLSLLHSGGVAEAREHFDHAIALYDPSEHRQLSTRFGQDVGVSVLGGRSQALWMLGYPEAALADVQQAFKGTREIGQAATLMYTQCVTGPTLLFCGDYTAVMAQSDEVIALADDKGAVAWKAFGMMNKGCALALTGKSTDALPMLISGLAAFRSTGATLYGALCLSSLARAYADIGKFDDARRSIDEAITLTQTTKERWYEGETLRTSGEIILLLRDSNAGKAEAYFERALAIARQQQAKSWELRAATSMAALRSRVSNPSVNQPYTGASSSRACCAGALLESAPDMSRVSGVTSARRYLLRNLSGTRGRTNNGKKSICLLALWLWHCARTIGADPARASLRTYVGHPVSELIARFGLSLAWTVKNTRCLGVNSWQRHSRRL